MQPELVNTRAEDLQEWGRQIAERLHLPTTLVKFLIVGGIGFLINLFVLSLTYDAGAFWFIGKDSHIDLGLVTAKDGRLLLASITAVEIAIVCQFNLHERWTFRKRNREGNIFVRFVKYNVSAAVSPLITVVCVNTLTPVFRDVGGEGSIVAHLAPYIATTVGVLVGFTWNYTLNTLVIWPHLGKPDAEG